MKPVRLLPWVFSVVLLLSVGAAAAQTGLPDSTAGGGLPAMYWAVLLFLFCFGIGILAVLAGVGGGVLFVPLVGTLFPFHMDFVRGASLFVALAGALSSSGRFLVQGLTFPRLILPLSLVASVSAIAGAMVGLSLPESLLRVLLGVTMVAICLVMLRSKRSDYPETGPADGVTRMLGISGSYHEPSTDHVVEWHPHRMSLTIVLFIGIGFIAGLFGLGAGWASVPVLNLVMGAPLKAAVASSLFIISISNTPPAVVYLNSGAVLPIITLPSVLGMMLGSKVGTRIMSRTHPKVVRRFVISLLAVAGLVSLLKGLGAI